MTIYYFNNNLSQVVTIAMFTFKVGNLKDHSSALALPVLSQISWSQPAADGGANPISACGTIADDMP